MANGSVKRPTYYTGVAAAILQRKSERVSSFSSCVLIKCEATLHATFRPIYFLFKHQRQRAEATYMPVKSVQ